MLPLLLLLTTAYATTPVISRVAVDSAQLTHGQARLSWATDITSTTRIKLATVSGGPYTNYDDTSPNSTINHSFVVTVTPGLYYYKVCSTNGVDEACSSEGSFTTPTLPSPHPVPATLPTTIDVTFPTQTGTTRTTASDCSDFASKWALTTWGDTLIIPANAVCVGMFTLTATADPYVAGKKRLLTTNLTTLPPPGIRLPANITGLPRLESNLPLFQSDGAVPAAGAASACRPVGKFMYATDDPRPFKMWRCAQGSAITGATTSNATPITVTKTAHGLVTGQYVWSQGFGTNPVIGTLTGPNGLWSVTSTGADTFTLDSSTTDGSTHSGGTYRVQAWEAVPYTTNAGPPVGACTPDTWVYDTVAASRDGYYYCTPDSVWRNLRNRPLGVGISEYETEALKIGTGAHDIWIVGLDVTHVKMATYTGNPGYDDSVAYTMIGRKWRQLVSFEDDTIHDVIIDRCLIHGADTNNTQQSTGIQFNGNTIAVINSRIYDIASWTAPALGTWGVAGGCDSCSAGMLFAIGDGPYLFDNNYNEWVGFGLYFTDTIGHWLRSPSQITVSRSHFLQPLKWHYGDPSFNGRVIQSRHPIEFKIGRVVDIRGNTIENGWECCWTQGFRFRTSAMHQVGFPGGTYRMDGSSQTGNTVTLSRPTPGLAVNEYYYDGTDVCQVTGVTSTTVFTSSCSKTVSFGAFDLRRLAPDNQESDYTYRYNRLLNIHNGFDLGGPYVGHGGNNYALPTVPRQTLIHNLITGVNYYEAIAHGMWGQDILIDHNTIAYPAVSGPVSSSIGLCTADCVSTPTYKGEGLQITNNIIWYDNNPNGAIAHVPGSVQGTAGIADSFLSSTVTDNLFAKTGAAAGYTGLGVWYDLTTPFPFGDAANNNYFFTASGSSYATYGASVPAINSATGTTASTHTPIPGSTYAVFQFSASQEDSCFVQYSTDSFTTSTTATWTGSVATPTAPQIILTGLTASTIYSYISGCRSIAPTTGSFTTTATGSSSSFSYIATGLTGQTASMTWGTTPSLLDGSVSGVSCSTNCVLTATPITTNIPLYYKTCYSGGLCTSVRMTIPK